MYKIPQYVNGHDITLNKMCNYQLFSNEQKLFRYSLLNPFMNGDLDKSDILT